MSKPLTKEEVKSILADKAKFDKTFEETFKKYDKNMDKSIDLKEYASFIKDMLESMGRKNFSLPTTMANFERADKNSDGSISKDEFKKEFEKRLKQFAG
jgi:Ca2+-binding EF-hand superfamily protein